MWLLYGFITVAKVGGDAAANIAFNFWLRSFPNGSAAQFTVLLVSALFYVLLFVPPMLAALVVARKRAIQEVKSQSGDNGDGKGERDEEEGDEGKGAVPSLLSASATLQKLRGRKSLALLAAVGASDFWIDVASTYAAGQTSVLTQAFAKGLEPFITWLICLKLLPAVKYAPVSTSDDNNDAVASAPPPLAASLNDGGDDGEKFSDSGDEAVKDRAHSSTRCSPLLIFSFVFSACGLLLHLLRNKFTKLDSTANVHTKASTGVKWFYVGLYIASIVGNAFYNISQGAFMRRHNFRRNRSSSIISNSVVASTTRDDDVNSDVSLPLRGEELQQEQDDNNNNNENKNANTVDGGTKALLVAANTTTTQYSSPSSCSSSLLGPTEHSLLIRLVVLGGDMIVSLLLLLVFGSLIDSIPHFGSSASPAAAWGDFHNGLRCIFNCNDTGIYTIITFAGWAVAYVADTYLNAISPPLSSMVAEMSAPIQALVLIAIPAWAIDGGGKHDWQTTASDMGGLVLMALGVCLYLRWEMRNSL